MVFYIERFLWCMDFIYLPRGEMLSLKQLLLIFNNKNTSIINIFCVLQKNIGRFVRSAKQAAADSVRRVRKSLSATIRNSWAESTRQQSVSIQVIIIPWSFGIVVANLVCTVFSFSSNVGFSNLFFLLFSYLRLHQCTQRGNIWEIFCKLIWKKITILLYFLLFQYLLIVQQTKEVKKSEFLLSFFAKRVERNSYVSQNLYHNILSHQLIHIKVVFLRSFRPDY